jgi:hypothetical protein
VRHGTLDVRFVPIADIHPFIWNLSEAGYCPLRLDEILAVFAGPLATGGSSNGFPVFRPVN